MKRRVMCMWWIAGNHRVEEFSGEGAFVAAWGWGVRDGKAEYEVCTSGCRAGLAGTGKGAAEGSGAVAVDNSPGGAGTVYVAADASAKRPDVQRFPADGEQARWASSRSKKKGAGWPRGRSDTGPVWLYRGEEEETGVVEGFSGRHAARRGLKRRCSRRLRVRNRGSAVDVQGEDFYVDHELLSGEGECPAVVEREKAEQKEPAEGDLLRPVVTGKLDASGSR